MRIRIFLLVFLLLFCSIEHTIAFEIFGVEFWTKADLDSNDDGVIDAAKLPAAGSGDVTGPAGATAGNIPVLDATGKILSDSGKAPGDFLETEADPTVDTSAEIQAIIGAGVYAAAGETGIDIVTVTETGTLSAEQLTGSRIEYTGTGTATFTLGSASDAYTLSQGASTFIFMATEGAYFDPAAADKITYIDGSIHTLDDGDKLAALTPSKYDAFTIRPVKDGADYQWLIHCSTGLYEDGGP